jgi:hypothetical protein
MPALQLRLPKVVVRVDKPRGYDLASAVDNFRAAVGRREILSHIGNEIAADKHIGVVQGENVAVLAVSEHGTALKEDR